MSQSLLVRDENLQKLDYTHCGTKGGNVRNLKLSMTCQRCGSESEELICDKCRNEQPKRGQARTQSGWEQLLKHVTVSGCDVLVNGKIEQKCKDSFHAEVVRKALNKIYLKHNLECLSHIK